MMAIVGGIGGGAVGEEDELNLARGEVAGGRDLRGGRGGGPERARLRVPQGQAAGRQAQLGGIETEHFPDRRGRRHEQRARRGQAGHTRHQQQ